jgi:hypothetical protein
VQLKIEYVLTGVGQSDNIRSYAFSVIDRDLRRMDVTVAVDISLLRKYAIPLQELPLLCRHFLEAQPNSAQPNSAQSGAAQLRNLADQPAAAEPGASSDQNLTYGEAEMMQYATRRADAGRALQARKALRKRNHHRTV